MYQNQKLIWITFFSFIHYFVFENKCGLKRTDFALKKNTPTKNQQIGCYDERPCLQIRPFSIETIDPLGLYCMCPRTLFFQRNTRDSLLPIPLLFFILVPVWIRRIAAFSYTVYLRVLWLANCRYYLQTHSALLSAICSWKLFRWRSRDLIPLRIFYIIISLSVLPPPPPL
jgi:hypothetical protein